ncbi:MAG: hypothetical protein ACKVVT_00875 [Dehalococcoidia bacterium]
MDDVALILVIAARGLIPIAVFRWPFWAGAACIAGDAFDTVLPEALGITLVDDYHRFDKFFDTYYLAFEAVVAWRLFDPVARAATTALFALRLAAVIVFEVTGARWLFLVGPNAFENFYLLVAGLRTIDPAFRIPGRRELVVMLLVATLPKLMQEYVMHYREAQTWHFVKEHVLLWR